MPQNDYYQTLGVERAASADEIRKAYRKLARKHHPDLNPGDKSAEDRFKKVQEAYDILSEPKKKEMYDQYGFYSENGMPAGGPGGPGGPGAGPNMGFGGFDFSDFTRTAGSGSPRGRPPGSGGAGPGESANFQDIFSQWFGRQHEPQETAPEKGTDLEYGLSIDFWQAIRGTQVRLKINRQEVCTTRPPVPAARVTLAAADVCPECNGSGTVTQMAGAMRFSLTCPRCEGTGRLTNKCSTCHGDGRISHAETVEVRIPPGAQQGSRLRAWPGRAGNAGERMARKRAIFISLCASRIIRSSGAMPTIF